MFKQVRRGEIDPPQLVLLLCAVLVVLVGVLLFSARRPRVRRVGTAGGAARAAASLGPVSLVFAVRKEMAITSDARDFKPVALSDEYFTRVQVQEQEPAGTYKVTGGLRCQTALTADKSQTERTQEILVTRPEGLAVARTERVLIAVRGEAPVAFDLRVESEPDVPRPGWPLIDEFLLAPIEEAQYKKGLSPSPGEGRLDVKSFKDALELAVPRVAFNPQPGETLRITPEGEETIEVIGGKDLRCFRLGYGADARHGKLSHKIEGTVWVLPGVGPIQEVRHVTMDQMRTIRDLRSPDPRATRELLTTMKTTAVRKLALRPEKL